MDSEGLIDVAGIAWVVVLFTFSIFACLHSANRHRLPHYCTGARRSQDYTTGIAKQALGIQFGGMGEASEWSDVPCSQEGYEGYSQQEEAMNQSPETLLQLMHDKFPGMEHYYISEEYENPTTAQGRRAKAYPHKAHVGYIYCGFVDSLFSPTQGHCWRSVTYNGLYRLVLSEDPDYAYDEQVIPETRRRFKI